MDEQRCPTDGFHPQSRLVIRRSSRRQKGGNALPKRTPQNPTSPEATKGAGSEVAETASVPTEAEVAAEAEAGSRVDSSCITRRRRRQVLLFSLDMEPDRALLEYAIKAMIDHPEAVETTRAIDQMGVLLTLTVHPEGMGKVIGRSGKTAEALRIPPARCEDERECAREPQNKRAHRRQARAPRSLGEVGRPRNKNRRSGGRRTWSIALMLDHLIGDSFSGIATRVICYYRWIRSCGTGIRESNDIDMVVTRNLFKELQDEGWPIDEPFKQKWNRVRLKRENRLRFLQIYICLEKKQTIHPC